MATSISAMLPAKQDIGTPNPALLRRTFTFNMKGNADKRKSAVELLQETKAYYVKSERVLDTKQELRHSQHFRVSSTPGFDYLLRAAPSKGSTPTQEHAGVGASFPFADYTCGSATDLYFQESEQMPVVALRHYSTATCPDRTSLERPEPGGIERSATQGCLPSQISPPGIRPRAKSQTEFGRASELRRSYQRDREDVQIQLRRLLNGDSDHLTCNGSSIHDLTKPAAIPATVQRISVTERILLFSSNNDNSKFRCESPSKNPISPTDDFIVRRKSGLIKSRTAPEGSLSCIHKSMPELSPGKSGCNRSVANVNNNSCSSTSSSGSLLVLPPRSAKNRSSENRGETSDYASRSPSCRQGDSTFSSTHSPPCQQREDVVLGLSTPTSTKCVMSFSSNTLNSSAVGPIITAAKTSVVEVLENNNQEEDNQSVYDNVEIKASPKKNSPPQVFPKPNRTLPVNTPTNANKNAENIQTEDSELKRRPILRSKSDISHRYSKLSVMDTNGNISWRNSMTNSDIEQFFTTMGLDKVVLRSIRDPPSPTDSIRYFSSTSSIDSSSHHHHSRKSTKEAEPAAETKQEGLKESDLLAIQHGHMETSIVERNARVIKWLFHLRKVQAQTTPLPVT